MKWFAVERRMPVKVSSMSEEETQQAQPIAGIGTMVFGKWDAQEVVCGDPGLAPYINLTTIGTPHSGGRHANAGSGSQNFPSLKRFINNLMRTGKFSGKKQHCAKAFESALDNIAERTGENPLQHFIDAIVNSAPCEETTRIKFGAVSQPKAVDSSPSRRLDVALQKFVDGLRFSYSKEHPCSNSRYHSELNKAAAGDVASFAVGKKDEIERIAASAR